MNREDGKSMTVVKSIRRVGIYPVDTALHKSRLQALKAILYDIPKVKRVRRRKPKWNKKRKWTLWLLALLDSRRKN